MTYFVEIYATYEKKRFIRFEPLYMKIKEVSPSSKPDVFKSSF